MERGCVEDQPQQVTDSEWLEIQKRCGWSRTTPRSGIFQHTPGDSAVPSGLISSAFVPGSELPGYYQISLREKGRPPPTARQNVQTPGRFAPGAVVSGKSYNSSIPAMVSRAFPSRRLFTKMNVFRPSAIPSPISAAPASRASSHLKNRDCFARPCFRTERNTETV
jgi:hypothetical protein